MPAKSRYIHQAGRVHDTVTPHESCVCESDLPKCHTVSSFHAQYIVGRVCNPLCICEMFFQSRSRKRSSVVIKQRVRSEEIFTCSSLHRGVCSKVCCCKYECESVCVCVCHVHVLCMFVYVCAHTFCACLCVCVCACATCSCAVHVCVCMCTHVLCMFVSVCAHAHHVHVHFHLVCMFV